MYNHLEPVFTILVHCFWFKYQICIFPSISVDYFPVSIDWLYHNKICLVKSIC